MKRNLQVSEAAEMLSCSRRSIYRLLERGEITGFKIGSSLRITSESLHAFRNRAVALYQEENGIEGPAIETQRN